MATEALTPILSGSPPKRPKGILKNRSTSNVTAQIQAEPTPPSPEAPAIAQRPSNSRELSEREVVLANTLHNAGNPPNRRPSAGRDSRRQSGVVTGHNVDGEENSQRLKWDEANLYLTEQQRDSTMKITEPKTPYAKQYDPSEDADEMAGLDAGDLLVDEVDQKRLRQNRLDEIPGLDIGEPEMDTQRTDNATPESEKRVMVDAELNSQDDGHHGEDLAHLSEEEQAKHRKFEELRKKHYEMKDIKGLLGHPELAEDEDADEDMAEAPPLPASSTTIHG